jgi:hypothetical protein
MADPLTLDAALAMLDSQLAQDWPTWRADVEATIGDRAEDPAVSAILAAVSVLAAPKPERPYVGRGVFSFFGPREQLAGLALRRKVRALQAEVTRLQSLTHS